MAVKGTTKVDLNEATKQELIEVAKMPEKTAEAIVKRRQEQGDFGSFDELNEVAGMTKELIGKLQASFAVGQQEGEKMAKTAESQTSATADAAARTSERLMHEQSSRAEVTAEQLQGAMRENVERASAMAEESRKAAAQGAQGAMRVGMLWMSYWPEQLNESMSTMARMVSCRSFEDAARVQSDYMRNSMQRFTERMRATMEMTANTSVAAGDRVQEAGKAAA